uniref:MFS transporter n=1 Tax=Thermorudis peleae TaxID=1382356 RepID=A0A831THX8_9BACT
MPSRSRSAASIAALASYWSVMLLRQVNEPLYAAWINQGLSSSVRATVLSISSQADALGQIAGGPLVGLIGLHISVQAALGISAGALVPAVLLLLVVARHQALLSARRPSVADPAAGDGWR